MEEIAFSEWSDRLDVTGSNHWLPAYGYQEAMLGRGAEDNDGSAVLIAGQSQQFLFLETIVEETSDDLRSESDKSGTAGWLDSDSDTGSVIHVPRNIGLCEWSGSERDLAVPKKRRRRTEEDDDDEVEVASLSSRSSSLLQFENLEKHCQDVLVLCEAASSDESSLEDSSSSSSSDEDDASSDGTLHHSSWSSRDSGRIRSYRSFDSLNLLQQHKKQLSLVELSQSLNNEGFAVTLDDDDDDDDDDDADESAEVKVTSPSSVVVEEVGKDEPAEIRPATQPQRSVENLSEDSGFGDHIPRLLGGVHSAATTILEDEDSSYTSSSSYDSDYSAASGETEDSRNTTASSTLLKLVDNFKFMEGRGWDVEESKFNTGCWQSTPSLSSRGAPESASTTAMANNRSTPNLAYTCSENSVPLKHFSLDDDEKPLTPLTSAGSAKGVHFCPVVSELSWRESYSEEEEEDEEDDVTTEDDEGVRDYDEDVDDTEDDETDSGSEGEAVLLAESLVVVVAEEAAAASPPTISPSHVVERPASEVSPAPVDAAPAMEVDATKKRTGRFGGFFQRFSFRRRRQVAKTTSQQPTSKTLAARKPSLEYQDVTIIPLHPPPTEVVISAKPPLPPLPPRVVGASVKAPASRRVVQPGQRPTPAASSSSMSGLVIDRASRGSAGMQHPTGLLETDLDTDITVSAPRPPLPKKARSLLNLGGGNQVTMLKPPQAGHRPHHHHGTPDHRAKSMEFLLDKENQAAVQPPENELQKIGAGERVMSEHQLRVQRSLQKLNVPDWYKNSVAGRPEGFRLKRDQQPTQHQGWPGLGSKTTSLSSLGSSQSAAARSPTGCHLLSPSPTPSPHVFTRWSTSRLNSTATSTSTSPCGSTRSSFNYRQPYLGWRSQERLSRPRTPAERLAAGIPQQVSPTKQQVPNLSEVRTSIKEVTSAIVHYVSGVRDGSGGDMSHLEDSPSNRSPRWEGEWGSISRSSSPRGSGRMCWLESSFVGSRPLDSPETPLTLPTTHVQNHKTLKALDNDVVASVVPERISSGGDLYLDFHNSKPPPHTRVNGEYLLT